MIAIVTGGAGFIGSHLVDRLLQKGWKVVVIDNFENFLSSEEEKLSNISNSEDRSLIIRADIRDFDKISRMLPKDRYDIIIHLAAKAGVRGSVKNIQEYQETNILGTSNVLELARKHWIRRVIFASSSSVYGINPNVPWKETEPLMPISPYAYTKLSGEMLGHVYNKLYGISFLALRFFTVYGPRQRPDLAIRKFSEKIIKGEEIPVFGDGNLRRDFTYVDDIIDGIMKAIEYTGSPYEVINLGSNKPYTVNELLLILQKSLDKKARIKYTEQELGDVPQTYADLEKAQQLLNYKPKINLEEGIDRFVKWMRST